MKVSPKTDKEGVSGEGGEMKSMVYLERMTSNIHLSLFALQLWGNRATCPSKQISGEGDINTGSQLLSIPSEVSFGWGRGWVAVVGRMGQCLSIFTPSTVCFGVGLYMPREWRAAFESVTECKDWSVFWWKRLFSSTGKSCTALCTSLGSPEG